MEASQDQRQEFRIAAAGPFVHRALRDSPRGKVTAVFERSFYATFEDRWICILPPRGGLGPLNARCSEAGLEHAIARFVRVGADAVVDHGMLSIGAALSFDFRHAATWSPPPLTHCEPHSIAHGMEALRRLLD